MKLTFLGATKTVTGSNFLLGLAGKKIIIPLIGSGITTMTGIKEKNNTMLLKCMLCTLKRSRFQPKNGITIVLTDETINNINMVKIKEEFKNGI